MDVVTAETIIQVSSAITDWQPTHTIAHGDRTEALSAAISSTLNNVPVIHIEGGEISGTADESMRHAISKLSHFHLVSNETAAKRLVRMGENPNRVAVIGSPELDAMHSTSLPTLEEVRNRYEINFTEFAICLYHPVTTELPDSKANAESLARAMLDSGLNYVLIGSNNDLGNESIGETVASLNKQQRFKHIPSMRFDHYVTLLKNSLFIIGNSSSGVREAPYLGKPSINVGTRQNGRNTSSASVRNASNEYSSIKSAIEDSLGSSFAPDPLFGDGKSADAFEKLLDSGFFRTASAQKFFYEEDSL